VVKLSGSQYLEDQEIKYTFPRAEHEDNYEDDITCHDDWPAATAKMKSLLAAIIRNRSINPITSTRYMSIYIKGPEIAMIVQWDRYIG